MTAFTKDQEHYIEHEVKIRLHDTNFSALEKSIDRLDNKIDTSIDRLDKKIDTSIDRLDNTIDKLDRKIDKLDNKLEASINHLDNKFMLMFSVVLGSIWLPAILHYLHIT